MSATIIAFPLPHRSAKPGDYAFMEPLARRYFLEQKIKGLLADATPAPPTAEAEMLKLLRRIDRRLAVKSQTA